MKTLSKYIGHDSSSLSLKNAYRIVNMRKSRRCCLILILIIDYTNVKVIVHRAIISTGEKKKEDLSEKSDFILISCFLYTYIVVLSRLDTYLYSKRKNIFPIHIQPNAERRLSNGKQYTN